MTMHGIIMSGRSRSGWMANASANDVNAKGFVNVV